MNRTRIAEIEAALDDDSQWGEPVPPPLSVQFEVVAPALRRRQPLRALSGGMRR